LKTAGAARVGGFRVYRMHPVNQLEPLHIALWDLPDLRDFAAGLDGRPFGWDLTISFTSREECESLLRTGRVDVAMIATVEALTQEEAFAILPGVALSSWMSPNARIRLEAGLAAPPEQIAFAPEFSQEALMARIVLREHYAMEPAFAPDGAPEVQRSSVIVGSDVPPASETVLDLGQEWSELTNYPMVWGVFSVRPGEAKRSMVDLLLDAVEVWERSREETSEIEQMLSAEPRFRLDDIATASLTEFCDLLYFYKVASEIPAVAFAGIEEEQRNDPTADDDQGWPDEDAPA
jgi:predicted solute-binding protein